MPESQFLTEPQSYKWSRLIHHSNAQSDPAPQSGYIEQVTRVFFRSVKNAVWINYYFSSDITSDYETNWKRHFSPFEDPEVIHEALVLLPFSLVNAGHSQCQLLGYHNIISHDPSLGAYKLCISSVVKEYLPHVYELLVLLFGDDRIVVLDSRNTYFLSCAYLIQASTSVDVRRSFVNVLWHDWYQDLQIEGNPYDAYTEDVSCIINAVRDIRSSYVLGSERYDKIFFVKTMVPDGRSYVGSPHRAIEISNECRDLMLRSGFKIISLDDFKDLRHCIAILSQARQVITSWGNIAAANRFFYNSDAIIVLLGNTAYSNEYESMPKTDFFGLLVFPVKKQYVIRDFPDVPSVQDLERVLSLF